MKYFKMHKEADAKAVEITKEDAMELLAGYWYQEFLDDMFEKELVFRLYTPYSFIWSRTDDGRVAMPGFYGICD